MIREQKKKSTLLMLLACYFVGGFGSYLLANAASDAPSTADNIFTLVFSLVGLILIMRWFVLDAGEHNYKFSKAMFLMMVAMTILAAPFYFIQTRGTRAWLPIARALLFLAICFVSAACGMLAAYGVTLAKYKLMG